MSRLGTGEQAVNEIARRQRGLISAEQCRVAGLGRKPVARRVAQGSWTEVQRRVYATGPGDLPPAAVILAAVLASGPPGAVASHLAAAWLYRLIERWSAPVDLTVFGRGNPGSLAHVRLHRPSRSPAVRWHNGIPLTGALDTLFGIAPVLDLDDLEAAVAKAHRAGLVSRSGLRDAVAVAGPRRGIVNLRAVAAAPKLTRSANERLLLDLLRAAELSGYDTNVVVEGKEVDVYFPDARLAIEMDAYGTHGDAASFEDDHLLDADLEAVGIKLLRFTGRRIRARREAVLARIVAALVLRLGYLPVSRRRS